MAITIAPAPPLPLVTVGDTYASLWGPFVASGGTGPYTYAIHAGTTPSDFVLNSDGTVSGTASSGDVNTYDFTVRATDSLTATGDQEYAGSVVDGPASVSPNGSLGSTTTGDTFSKAFSISGGISPYVATVAGGNSISRQVQGGQYISNLQYNPAQYEYNSAFRTRGGVGSGVLTDYVVAFGFFPGVPEGATVTGITAKLTWQGQHAGTGVLENIALFYKGAIIGTVKNPATSNSATSTTNTYGGAADLWGAELTADIVNDATFGFGVQIETETVSGSDRSFLFTFELDVEYGTLPASLALTTIDATDFQISGVVTAPAGLYNFAVVITDAEDIQTTVDMSLQVNAAPVAQFSLLSIPPSYPDSCLGEGRKIVTYAINWETAPLDNVNNPFASLFNGQALRADILMDVLNLSATALQGLIVSIVGLIDTQYVVIDDGTGCPIILGNKDVTGADDNSNGTNNYNLYTTIPLYAPPGLSLHVYLVDVSNNFYNLPVMSVALTNFKVEPFVTQSVTFSAGITP